MNVSLFLRPHGKKMGEPLPAEQQTILEKLANGMDAIDPPNAFLQGCMARQVDFVLGHAAFEGLRHTKMYARLLDYIFRLRASMAEDEVVRNVGLGSRLATRIAESGVRVRELPFFDKETFPLYVTRDGRGMSPATKRVARMLIDRDLANLSSEPLFALSGHPTILNMDGDHAVTMTVARFMEQAWPLDFKPLDLAYALGHRDPGIYVNHIYAGSAVRAAYTRALASATYGWGDTPDETPEESKRAEAATRRVALELLCGDWTS